MQPCAVSTPAEAEGTENQTEQAGPNKIVIKMLLKIIQAAIDKYVSAKQNFISRSKSIPKEKRSKGFRLFLV